MNQQTTRANSIEAARVVIHDAFKFSVRMVLIAMSADLTFERRVRLFAARIPQSALQYVYPKNRGRFSLGLVWVYAKVACKSCESISPKLSKVFSSLDSMDE